MLDSEVAVLKDLHPKKIQLEFLNEKVQESLELFRKKNAIMEMHLQIME